MIAERRYPNMMILAMSFISIPEANPKKAHRADFRDFFISCW
jgi:hypothetical protein